MYDTNRHNFGKVLEDVLFEKLQNIGVLQKIEHEDILKRKWGWRAASVDYMLELDNFIILIQCKWRRSRRRENKGISNFLESVQYIKNIYKGKEVLFGMWISRINPFDDNVQTLWTHNIVCVSEYDSIDWLVEKSIQMLTHKLRDYKIML